MPEKMTLSQWEIEHRQREKERAERRKEDEKRRKRDEREAKLHPFHTKYGMRKGKKILDHMDLMKVEILAEEFGHGHYSISEAITVIRDLVQCCYALHEKVDGKKRHAS